MRGLVTQLCTLQHDALCAATYKNILPSCLHMHAHVWCIITNGYSPPFTDKLEQHIAELKAEMSPFGALFTLLESWPTQYTRDHLSSPQPPPRSAAANNCATIQRLTACHAAASSCHAAGCACNVACSYIGCSPQGVQTCCGMLPRSGVVYICGTTAHDPQLPWD